MKKKMKMMMMMMIMITMVTGSYRHYHLDNADICAHNGGVPRPGTGPSSSMKKKTRNNNHSLFIGSGASIFKLNKPSLGIQPHYYNKAAKCRIHVRAPKDHGIMVHIEMMYMRTTSSSDPEKCLDYIQFGQDDIVPFLTVKKSNRICGQLSGFTYDDPTGSLLMWVNLGGRKATTMWPHISVVNLTLIATVYRKNCKIPEANQIKCYDPDDRCIWKKYACDRHLNCPTDKKNPTADEDGCSYDHLQIKKTDKTTDKTDKKNLNLNLVSFIMIIICSLLFVLLLGFLVLRLKKGCQNRNSRNSCELPQQPVYSLEELEERRRMRPPDLQDSNNVYLSLTSFIQHRQNNNNGGQNGGQNQGHQGGGPPADEPPPAYDTLFPIETVSESIPQNETDPNTRIEET